MASSTVSLNLVWCVFLISSAASPSLYGRASTSLRTFSIFLPYFLVISLSAPAIPRRPRFLGFHDVQTRVARRAHHGAHRRVQTGGVEIDKLDFRDVLDLLFGYLADLVAIRLRRTLGDSRGAQQQHGSRRSLEDEGEGAVRVHGDQDGENHAVRFLRGLRVELLAKIHDVQPVRAERGADRRRRRGFARGQLQLDRRGYFLWRHFFLPLTQFLDAREIQFHRSRASKNCYRNLQTTVIVVDFLDGAVEIRKRTIHYAHLLVALIHHLGLRPVRRNVHPIDDGVHFRFRQRRRRSGRADETGHPRRIAHDVPGIFVQIHFHQHVPRIRHPRRNHFFAAAHFHHIFHGDQHAPDLVLQIESGHTALQALLHLLFKARVGVNDVPLHRHRSRIPSEAKLMKNVLHSMLHAQVDQPEKDTEEENRGDNHARCRNNVLARGPGHLFQLHASFLKKLAKSLHRPGDFVGQLG